MLHFKLQYAPLKFKRPSGTSRGILTEKHTWYISISSDINETYGIGEVSIIPGLTPEFIDLPSFQQFLETAIVELNQAELNLDNFLYYINFWYDKPSLFFGLETAYYDLIAGGKMFFYDTPFTRKEASIPINGLIWMGEKSFMKEQIKEKLAAGFTCIKTKIGAIDFETELDLLGSIRKEYNASEIILRVDANGAFSYKDAPEKLKRLADLDIHSIEQPIRAGNWDKMYELCKTTPCPIALDEELIGIYDKDKKQQLLTAIQPQFIILKPSLHGGIQGCKEWVQQAEALHIPWWMTSALESNVGLNMIAQFVSTYPITLHQGLGTGGLYVKNTVASTEIREGKMWFIRNY